MNGNDFADKVVVVTGASGGIGRAIVEYFSARGAKLGATYHRNPAVKHLVEDLELGPERILVRKIDITDSASCSEFAADCKKQFGHVDFLVNNAAVLRMASVKDMTDSLWREVISTNLDSVFFMCRAFIPLMGAGGSIVNISSAAAHRGAIDHSAYAATKAAVLAFSRSLARELAPDIRCNAISPGMIDTEMLDELPTETVELLKAESPLNRLGKPSEIAGAVGFLCSETSSFVTAETLHVNGACYIAS